VGRFIAQQFSSVLGRYSLLEWHRERERERQRHSKVSLLELRVFVRVSQELLWLRHGNRSGIQRKRNVRHWKQLPED
jgi:hypothetical protein